MMRAHLLWVPLLSLVWGCGDSKPKAAPPKAATPAPAKVEAAKAEGGEENVPLSVEWSYQPAGKRDPFRSHFDNYEAGPLVAAVNQDCGLLCQFELDQLRVVAVVSGVASPLAMIEDPEGRGHMVRRGNFVGKLSGKISDIRRDRVIVTELLRNQQGQVIPVETEMLLRSKDNKDRPGNQMVDLSMSDGSGDMP